MSKLQDEISELRTKVAQLDAAQRTNSRAAEEARSQLQKAENLARRNADREYRLELREELERKHGVEGHPKAGRLFALAWGYGHHAGGDEVKSYYTDLVSLIKEDEKT